MSKVADLEKHFERAMSSREQEVFLDTLLANSELSLLDLGALAKGRCRPLASGMSLQDVLDHAEARRSGTDSPFKSGRAVSTRTAKGRRDLDDQVLSFVMESDEACTATMVRTSIGGTPLQIRRSLNRLIERGEITYEGQARGTRYLPV